MTADDKHYFQELQKLVSDLGLQREVIFAGYREDMPDVLAAMDCFVHPSRRGAFVSVLIEAMATGLPVVASDVDGIPECVGRDGAAVLLPPDNPVRWADAVVRILADKSLASRMAERGRERASRLLDIGPLAQRTAEVSGNSLRGLLQPRNSAVSLYSGREIAPLPPLSNSFTMVTNSSGFTGFSRYRSARGSVLEGLGNIA